MKDNDDNMALLPNEGEMQQTAPCHSQTAITQDSSLDADQTVVPLVRHCADTYQGCCLPYKTPVTPNGWCVCNCGDCRVAKYQALERG